MATALYYGSPMYCPKCGDSLTEQRDLFLCERGRMELSQFMAERLYSGFVSRSEEPEDSRFTKGGSRFVKGRSSWASGSSSPAHDEERGRAAKLRHASSEANANAISQRSGNLPDRLRYV